jgi:hypothetical protein
MSINLQRSVLKAISQAPARWLACYDTNPMNSVTYPGNSVPSKRNPRREDGIVRVLKNIKEIQKTR